MNLMVADNMVRYFYPVYIGDYVAGVFVDWDQDEYGNTVMLLDTVNFDGCSERIKLPAHQSIKKTSALC